MCLSYLKIIIPVKKSFYLATFFRQLSTNLTEGIPEQMPLMKQNQHNFEGKRFIYRYATGTDFSAPRYY